MTDSEPPLNFSWVVENQLAAMAFPETVANLKFLYEQGIRHLITLSPERKPPMSKFPQLKWTEIPVIEFTAPSLAQIIHFITICEESMVNEEAVGIHCRQGRGRTGVMAACYLVRFHDLGPERSIAAVRAMRPGSIETHEQEKIVSKYRDYLRSQR